MRSRWIDEWYVVTSLLDQFSLVLSRLELELELVLEASEQLVG